MKIRTSPRRRTRLLLFFFAGGMLLCLAAAAGSAWSNQQLRENSHHDSQLNAQEEALSREVLNLKDQLGESIWAGWDKADIPLLLFNDSYAFLIQHPSPPAGWEAVSTLDASWTYYRYPLSRMESAPQNFALQIGEHWSGSLATPGKAAGYLIQGVQQSLPDPLEAVFPFRLAVHLMLPTDQWIAAALHESFHAYQAQAAPDRFADAELAYAHGERYWKIDAAMHEAWQTEMGLLVQALQADGQAEAGRLAVQFLDQRQQRRQQQRLDPDLVAFEQRMEWLEGLAMYVEFSSWQTADSTSGYQPLPGVADDPGFHGYHNFQAYWSRQLAEMQRQATQSNDIRLYFSGMAQAFLLDQLAPGWQTRIFQDATWLETLLAESLQPGAHQ